MLLVDIGHTRIKWVSCKAGVFTDQGAHVYEKLGLDAQLDGWFGGVSRQQDVFIACVADADVRGVIQQWFAVSWQGEVVFVQSELCQSGVTNGYLNPQQLGVDRWLAMLAAYDKYKSAVCVIDCGTAVTLDVIDQQGRHEGGLIIPGLGMMLGALSSGLGFEIKHAPRMVLTNNTADAVYQGCLNILCAGVQQLFQDYAKQWPDLSCVLTGGDAALIASCLACNCEIDSDLVLYGLKMIAETRP